MIIKGNIFVTGANRGIGFSLVKYLSTLSTVERVYAGCRTPENASVSKFEKSWDGFLGFCISERIRSDYLNYCLGIIFLTKLEIDSVEKCSCVGNRLILDSQLSMLKSQIYPGFQFLLSFQGRYLRIPFYFLSEVFFSLVFLIFVSGRIGIPVHFRTRSGFPELTLILGTDKISFFKNLNFYFLIAWEKPNSDDNFVIKF